MTLAARIAEAEARVAQVCKESPRCELASAWVLDAFSACLFTLADEVPHIRKSETACTVACPACRLRRKVEEAMA